MSALLTWPNVCALLCGSHLVRNLWTTTPAVQPIQLFSSEVQELRHDITRAHDLLNRVVLEHEQCDSRLWLISLALKISILLDLLLAMLWIFCPRRAALETRDQPLALGDRPDMSETGSSSDECVPPLPPKSPLPGKGLVGGRGPVRPSDLRAKGKDVP